jgi:hypothetical protein
LNHILIITGAISITAAIVHVQLSTKAADTVGLLAVFDHIFDLTLAVVLAFLALLIGTAVCERLKLEFSGPAEALSFTLFLGSGILGLSVLFLGILNLLHIWSVGLFLILATVLCLKSLGQLLQYIKLGFQTVTLTNERRVISTLFCCLVGVLFLRALTPPNTADEIIYHLPVPYEFAKRGSIYPSYDNLFGNLPLLVHMIYVLCQIARSDIAAKIFSLLLALGTSLALYGFCNRFLTRRTGVFAMFVFFGAGMVVEVAVTARIDVSLAGMVFLATYAMMNHLETGRQEWMWLSAVLAGFTLGIKSSAGPWLVFVGLMYLFEELFRKRAQWTPVLKNGLIYVALATAVASPWYVKNYVWFDNPVYPFFTGEVADFGSQGIRYFNSDDEGKLDAHLETVRQENPTIVNEQKEEIRGAINSRVPRHPLRFWEFFIQPDKYLVSEPFHFPNYLFLIIPLVLFVRPSRWIVWHLAISIGFFVVVTKSAWIARYLLPVYPSLTAVTASTLSSVSDRLSERINRLRELPVWVTAASLSFVIVVSLTWISGFNAVGFVTGRTSRHDFLRQFPFYHRIDFINTQLPSDARVMAVGAHMNYGIEREYLTDESWFATKWKRLLIRNDSLVKVNQDLHQQGFTHILYCSGPFTYEANLGIKGSGGMDLIAQSRVSQSEEARTLGPEYDLLRNWSTFTLYRSKFLEPIYTDQANCEVLRIK